MSLLVAAVVVSGFGQTVNDNLIHATPVRPWLLWVHGSVFSFWVLFFIFQSALVRTHNVKLHRTMGWFGAGLGTLIPVLGISTAIVMDQVSCFDHACASGILYIFCNSAPGYVVVYSDVRARGALARQAGISPADDADCDVRANVGGVRANSPYDSDVGLLAGVMG